MTRYRFVTAAVSISLFVLLLLYAAPRAAQAPDVTVLRGATVIDGTGAPPVPNAVIVIRGNRIEAIGQNITPPAGANVIDVAGKFITPGLWDKHLHYKSWFPELLITNGVTSGYAQEGGPWIEAQREGVEKGKILGPHMFIRIRQIDFWGSPDEARKRTQGLIKEGADFIKVYTGTTPEVLKAAAEEAHKAGLHVEGHIGLDARTAVENGIDGLVHATGIELSTVKPEVLQKLPQMPVVDTGRARLQFPKVATWNESKTGGPNPDAMEYWLWLEDPRRLMLMAEMDRDMAKDLIKLMVDRKVFIEGCLTYVFRHVHDHVEEFRNEDARILSDPNLRYLPPIVATNVLDYSLLDRMKPEDIATMKKGYRNFQWFIKTFVDAGGRIVMGPDTTSLNHATMLPGVTTVREMQLLVEAGLTPMQVIMASTKYPAEYIGAKAKDMGTLEKGKIADLLVLPANPLDDIKVFKHIERVMQNGRWQPVGYHYYFANPIPPERDESSVDFSAMVPPASQTPAGITSVSPAAVVEGSGPLTLTVRGHDFMITSVVELNGRWLKTERVSPGELRAEVPAELVAAVGNYPVRVNHRAPGWGYTNSLGLIVKFK